jgi:hypothetical protein
MVDVAVVWHAFTAAAAANPVNCHDITIVIHNFATGKRHLYQGQLRDKKDIAHLEDPVRPRIDCNGTSWNQSKGIAPFGRRNTEAKGCVGVNGQFAEKRSVYLVQCFLLKRREDVGTIRYRLFWGILRSIDIESTKFTGGQLDCDCPFVRCNTPRPMGQADLK